MMLIDPTRYIQLCKLAEQSRLEQAILHAWNDLFMVIIVILCVMLLITGLRLLQSVNELQELREILKQEPVTEKTAFDAVEMEKHNA